VARSLLPDSGTVDTERVRYAGGERVHDAGRVEDDRNDNGQHHELHERVISPGEQGEDCYDPDDAEEQWPEQSLQVGDQALRALGCQSRRGGEGMRRQLPLTGPVALSLAVWPYLCVARLTPPCAFSVQLERGASRPGASPAGTGAGKAGGPPAAVAG